MAKCNFCNKIVKQGRGMISIASDGRVINFCSGKCEKNFKLGRDPRKVNWVRKQKKKKEKSKEVAKEVKE